MVTLRARVGMSAACFFLASSAAGTAEQLPPEIQADRYLIQAEEQIEKQDFGAAKDAMDRILALQEQHGLEIPEAFFFRYAQVSEGAGLYDEAIEFVTRYLTLDGRDGTHYRDALRLLNAAEAAKAAAEEAAGAVRRRAEEIRNQSEAAIRRAEAAIAGMEFVTVPAGSFRMGSKSREAYSDERPVTRVVISGAFELGKYEVTQGQWEAVMGTNPTSFDDRCERCPVNWVSWDDVQEFIGRLNLRDLENRYRLPTEAEWEYAARAGTSGDRYATNLDAIAWCDIGDRPHAVGLKAPNAWGLYDMLGNMGEWVQDWHGAYRGGSVTDPRGLGSGSERVIRGGHWSGQDYFSLRPSKFERLNTSRHCRASYRFEVDPDYKNRVIGCRLVRIAR